MTEDGEKLNRLTEAMTALREFFPVVHICSPPGQEGTSALVFAIGEFEANALHHGFFSEDVVVATPAGEEK